MKKVLLTLEWAIIVTSGVLFILFPSSLAQTSKDQAQVDQARIDLARADAKQIMEMYEKYNLKFTDIHGRELFYGSDLKAAEDALAKLEVVEKEAIPTLQPALAAFAVKYGSERMDINSKISALGVKDIGDVGDKFEKLLRAVENVFKSRKATAESIASQAKLTLLNINFLVPNTRVEKMRETKAFLRIGGKFDPNNADINRMLASIDQRTTEVTENVVKDIDARTWTGHIKDFMGPGKTDELAKNALEYFKNDREWGRNIDREVEVLAVAVRGQWQVAETNLFGQVIRWRLPVQLAITNEKLKENDVAQVYNLSIVTKAGPPGKAVKAPPFDSYWVGNNWMMRLSKLPGVKPSGSKLPGSK